VDMSATYRPMCENAIRGAGSIIGLRKGITVWQVYG
jgi:hypothetical protein